MILFEETMMDASKIFFATVDDNFNSKKTYLNSTLRIDFLPEINTLSARFIYKTREEAISKLNQLTTLINLQRK